MNAKTISVLVAGILIGATIAHPLTQAAETWLKATPSTQSFYVDGQAVSLEAYAINGHNYVKLWDVGRAVGFGVAYDPARDAVLIGQAEETPDSGFDLDDPRMA